MQAARRPPGHWRSVAGRKLGGGGGGGRRNDPHGDGRFVRAATPSTPWPSTRSSASALGRRRGRAASSSTRRASGCWARRHPPVDEAAPLNPIEKSAWRAPHEQRVLAAASVRFSNRGRSARDRLRWQSRGIVGDLFKSAANGLVRVIGTGENHWPLVYDRDLGELYLMLDDERDGVGRVPRQRRMRRVGQRSRRGYRRTRGDQPKRPEGAVARGAEEDGHLRRSAGARPDRPLPARPRARLVAVVARRVAQCCEALRGVAARAGGGVDS